MIIDTLISWWALDDELALGELRDDGLAMAACVAGQDVQL